MSDEFELSRRKVLGAAGGIGLASVGAGLGTTAYLNDTESFQGNSLTAGELDLKVDWEEHYWDDFDAGVPVQQVAGSGEVGEGQVGLPDPQSPMVAVAEGDLSTFMNATAIEAFPDPDDDGAQEVNTDSFTYEPCNDGADLDADLDSELRTSSSRDDPLVNLDDVKPGDFGEVTFSFHLCDNPGYVWLQAANVNESSGMNTEPEGDETADLAENIQTVWWYDSRGDNVLQTNCPEQLYLTDSGTDPTTLYKVDLNGSAELTQLLPNGQPNSSDITNGNFSQTDAIAATPNGDEVVFYDKSSGHLGTYTVDDGSFTDDGAVSGNPGGVVLAGYSPSGTLWAASQDDDHLYTVDRSGPSVVDRGDTGIDLQGADLVFASDGTLYIWTAASADEGLYKVDDPSSDPTATPVSSSIGNKDSKITGLAIRDAGTGNIVASDTDSDSIVVIDRTDGSTVTTYPMTLGGSDYAYDFGDMTAGQLCGEVFRRGTLKEDLEMIESAMASGKGLPLDGNRASGFDELGGSSVSADRECFVPGVNHYIGFAWWLPRGVGNEVQDDSVSFNLGFYTEQCRHNDGSGSS